MSKQAMLELLDEEINTCSWLCDSQNKDLSNSAKEDLAHWREIRSLVEFALNVKNHVDTDWETKENSDE